MPKFYQDATDAIRAAVTQAPCGVAYRLGHGWFTYDACAGLESTADEPEFFMAKQGTIPIPLTDRAVEVWISILRAAVSK